MPSGVIIGYNHIKIRLDLGNVVNICQVILVLMVWQWSAIFKTAMSGEIFYKIKLYPWLYIVYSKYWEILKFWHNDYSVLSSTFFFDAIETVSVECYHWK